MSPININYFAGYLSRNRVSWVLLFAIITIQPLIVFGGQKQSSYKFKKTDPVIKEVRDDSLHKSSVSKDKKIGGIGEFARKKDKKLMGLVNEDVGTEEENEEEAGEETNGAGGQASDSADSDTGSMTDEQVSQSLSDMSEAQLSQQLTEIEASLAQCEENVGTVVRNINDAETSMNNMAVPEYLQMKKDLAVLKKCAKQDQRLVTLIKKEIFKRMKVTNSDRHTLQLKNQVLRVQQDINEMNSDANAALKVLDSIADHYNE